MINNLKVGHISFGKVDVLVDDVENIVTIISLSGTASYPCIYSSIIIGYIDFAELCFWAPLKKDDILIEREVVF